MSQDIQKKSSHTVLMMSLLFVVTVLFSGNGVAGAQNGKIEKTDPLNAVYTIQGEDVHLHDGRHEKEAAPESATKVKTTVLGRPIVGDVNGDGDPDAVLLLTQDPGGSGTFYYIAAALFKKGAYRGAKAVLLGDRITPSDLKIRNGTVIINYLDRRPGEAMSVPPSVPRVKYYIFDKDTWIEVKFTTHGEKVFEGWITIGHEVRSFVPCSDNRELWLLGTSPALNEVKAVYRKRLPHFKPYTPLFMVLTGQITDSPKGGFGAGYDAAISIAQYIRVWPNGNCKNELIYLESPQPGALVTSPLTIKGYARGTWFFEGDFPVLMEDSHGSNLARGFCTAKTDWMTEDFVRFEGTITFDRPVSGDKGSLILKKDNPTGLPKHDDALKIPIYFK